jgi:hypothetical protein
MRTAIKVLTVFNCVLFSPLIFIVLTLHSSPISTNVIKEQLITNQVYEKASAAIQKQVDVMEEDAEYGDTIFLISPIIKKEITETYIQNKSETLLADIDVWIHKNGPPPVVSFKDLKDTLIAKNSSTITQIQDAVREMESQQEVLKQAAIDEGQEGEGSEVPSFSFKEFDTFLASDWVVPVGANIRWMKTLVSAFRIIEIILLVCYTISFLCILLLSHTITSKLRWISVTVFLIALWNIPGIFLALGSSVFISTYVSEHVKGIPFALPFVQTLLAPMASVYVKMTTQAVIISCIGSVGVFILSFFVRQKDPIVSKTIRSTSRKQKK